MAFTGVRLAPSACSRRVRPSLVTTVPAAARRTCRTGWNRGAPVTLDVTSALRLGAGPDERGGGSEVPTEAWSDGHVASPSPETRQERKERTRQALLRASLRLLERRSFDRLSLRQVTKEVGIVPGAFYRHFRDMDELGLALVQESFGSLRAMIRSARVDVLGSDDAIVASVQTLVAHIHAHRAHFRFIARERSGGTAAVRRAIEDELRLFTDELAVDLRALPPIGSWSGADVTMLASLVVSTVVGTAAALTDLPRDRPEAEAAIITTTTRQLRLIFLGVPHWRSSPRP